MNRVVLGLLGDARHRLLAETYARRWPKIDVATEPIVSIVGVSRP